MISTFAHCVARGRLRQVSRRGKSDRAAPPPEASQAPSPLSFRSRDKFASIIPDQVLPSLATVSSDQLRQYLEHVASSLGVTSLDDWYRVKSRDFAQIHDEKSMSNILCLICKLPLRIS
jgi:predicted transcriptional regulator